VNGIFNAAICDTLAEQQLTCSLEPGLRPCGGKGFSDFQDYPDTITLQLVERVLAGSWKSREEAFEGLGRAFIRRLLADAIYGPIMRALGTDFPGVLSNLDRTLDLIKRSYPSLQKPTFEILSVSPGKATLLYAPARPNDAYDSTAFTTGFLSGLASMVQVVATIEAHPVESNPELPGQVHYQISWRVG